MICFTLTILDKREACLAEGIYDVSIMLRVGVYGGMMLCLLVEALSVRLH